MPARLAVAVIHGMGEDTKPGFADGLVAELRKRLAGAGKDPAEVVFQPVFWGDITQPAQDEYLRSAKAQADLNWSELRHFVVGAFGDAAAYQQSLDPNNSTQQLIHTRIRERLRDLYVTGLGSRAVPLVTMAHSLGGHILSNYIWDVQKSNVPVAALSNFERFATHAGMITFGCNIPLFTFAHTVVVPIAFPGAQLAPGIAVKARWYNYYGPNDVLGYPLKPISAAYARVVNEDIAIRVGGLFSAWNPLSHTKYWEDGSFTKPVAAFLATLL